MGIHDKDCSSFKLMFDPHTFDPHTRGSYNCDCHLSKEPSELERVKKERDKFELKYIEAKQEVTSIAIKIWSSPVWIDACDRSSIHLGRNIDLNIKNRILEKEVKRLEDIVAKLVSFEENEKRNKGE